MFERKSIRSGLFEKISEKHSATERTIDDTP